MKKNTKGLPDNLKSGLENLSGLSMDDVKVHYNSVLPAQLEAHAYSEGTKFILIPTKRKICLMKRGILYSKRKEG